TQTGGFVGCGLARSKSCSESATCRVHNDTMLALEMRLVWRCQLSNRAMNRSSRAAVSRETWKAASTCARSAASSFPSGGLSINVVQSCQPAAAATSASGSASRLAAAHVGGQQSQGGGGEAVQPTSVPDGAGSGGRQL